MMWLGEGKDSLLVPFLNALQGTDQNSFLLRKGAGHEGRDLSASY